MASLRQLLSLTKSLHQSQGSQQLSLLQLVPVHWSVLQVSVGASSKDNDESLLSAEAKNVSDHSTCKELIQSLLDQDQQESQSISSMSAAEQLFVFQYLLLRGNWMARPLSAFTQLLLPFLQELSMGSPDEQALADDDNNDAEESSRRSQEQDELLQALLQAVLGNATGDNWDPSELQSCLDQLEQYAASAMEASSAHNHEATSQSWKTSCRILTRLMEFTQSNSMVQQAVGKQIQLGVSTAVRLVSAYMALDRADCLSWIMPPVTNDLLPLLLSSTDMSALTNVWEQIWQLYRDEQDKPEAKQQAAIYLIVTSVLCLMVPYVVKEQCFQEQHQDLWQLIYTCVSQGLGSAKRWRSDENTNESLANTPILSKHEPKLSADVGTLQLLRRRGLYLLRVVVQDDPTLDVWNKYVACYETLEMESTPHLIDQTWETIAEIGATITLESERESNCNGSMPPTFSWKWLKVMLARVISTNNLPAVRKLGLFRVFIGQAGILAHSESNEAQVLAPNNNRQGPPRQKKTKNRPSKGTSGTVGAPLAVVTPDFVLESVILSFDTLEASVGTNMHLDDNKKESRQDMTKLFAKFLCSYVASLRDNRDRCQQFFLGLWGSDLLCDVSRKTAKLVFTSIAEMLTEPGADLTLSMSEDVLTTVSLSLHNILAAGSVLLEYQRAILEALSVILTHTDPVKDMKPLTILGILDLYAIPELDGNIALENTTVDNSAWIEQDASFRNLHRWLGKVQNDVPSWGATFGAGVAAAYVDGELTSDTKSSPYDPLVGLPVLTREMGKAIVIFCTLIGYNEGATKATAELLWPAINKGLSHARVALLGSQWSGADKIARSLVLMEYGCKLRVISGMGNGDLVLDRKTQSMMPPPQRIESLLQLSANFILQSLRVLLPSDNSENDVFKSANARSPVVRQATSSFGHRIGLLTTLNEGFPSSSAISESVDGLLDENVRLLFAGMSNCESSVAPFRVALIFAALASGGHIKDEELGKVCLALTTLEFADEGRAAVEEQTSRSIFQAAKWGSISILLTRLTKGESKCDMEEVVKRIFERMDESVHVVSLNAIKPLFDCLLKAAAYELLTSHSTTRLGEIVHALVTLTDEIKNSSDATAMFDAICQLIYRPELLLAESKLLLDDPDSAAPIRDSFREFIKQAGTQRTHIAAAVLCRIVYGWMGPDESGKISNGLAAIPYREDILSLLMFKEGPVDEASANQTFRSENFSDIIPLGVDDRSITRGFVIAFLCRLPDVGNGLPPIVLTELCQYLMVCLLTEMLVKEKAQIMLGSPSYCRHMRGWQALCVLSRFLTFEIAADVCEKVMEAFEDQMYGQIRYFLEVFTIQCARKFPAIFGKVLLREIRRTDISLQHIASLCIVVGALTCGRYQTDFFTDKDNVGLALAGVLPWLGSTQGFARAIAQLLVHKLIPHAIDVTEEHDGSDWYLRTVYDFLDRHDEMRRLRNKQSKFFESYDADKACTLDGILQLDVDEGGEAFPRHLVAVMKDTLREVFAEGTATLMPEWKRVEMMLNETQAEGTGYEKKDEVNFQRKIIPLDALNLALEDEKERKQRNRAGRKKQQLIVCASLIDKAPNLAGLARTAEIFAAERLIVPDLRITQMDNFKSVSVTAADWIEIEECSEANLLPWLRKQKRQGWFIVGLEQTSSSVSLEQFAFPDRPILLLLGKEKEGIPVEFLHVVDQCVEIPQLGIIRSLNVHVSGSIAIWEQTRQKIMKGNLTL